MCKGVKFSNFSGLRSATLRTAVSVSEALAPRKKMNKEYIYFLYMSSCPSLHRKFDPQTGYSKFSVLRSEATGKRSKCGDEGTDGSMPKSTPPISNPAHNLQLSTYSFDEILQMFGLSYQITLEDLKAAKRKVLMVHPDKSNLPSEYFLFYKHAFETVVQYYNNQTRQAQVVDEHTPTDYVPLTPENSHLQKTVQNINSKQFNSRFNELFEQNMWEKPDERQNEWFRSESSAPEYTPKTPVSVSNMSSAFDDIKTHQRNQGLVRYSGVRDWSSTRSGANFYDESAGEDGDYVVSDPFSKLKFEDLRKVHKDQTVFAVSEREYDAIPKYQNVEQYATQRNAGTLTPMEKAEAQRMFDHRESEARERAARQQHRANLKSQEYAEKNKRIVGAFLHLTT